MTAPNIRTKRQLARDVVSWHGSCRYINRDDAPSHTGDVKICPHRQIMVRIPANVEEQAWRTLSRFWTPIRYRRAVRALTTAGTEVPE